ncbi:RidA family protein [Geodermatophilus ruber]|uniref:Enamine deaminase RidA, house cleaning of reactive enamine intermediates, YjgF/YER057c/UK114 family n=1 Tax=Geodermatophilus ruber TaxID=504800 RepID=A0A1I4H9S4_9ACTN|nr:RidA family protein [Geodermatophilus ruber]SFL39038.1 Enamine deaminase RidA, house cleaning of reactive enamine intermediates, YjgF/YER057c/UK114 family [Geodermatophilus ruber]
MTVHLHRKPKGLGEPLGRYSHVGVVADGDPVFIAGQVGMAEDGQLYGDGSFADQVRGAYANLGTALAAVGGTFADIVKMTTYLVGGGTHLPEFMSVRGEVFAEIYPDGGYPPNTLLFVERLVEEPLLIEIEAVAAVPGAAQVAVDDA